MQPRIKVIYVIDVAPADWKFLNGHVTKDMLESICPLNDPDTVYVHCGPPGMNMAIRQMFAKYYP